MIDAGDAPPETLPFAERIAPVSASIEDADLAPAGQTADGVGHVDAGTLLSHDDRTDGLQHRPECVSIACHRLSNDSIETFSRKCHRELSLQRYG